MTNISEEENKLKCIVCGCEEFELIHHGTRDFPSIDVYKCCKCGGSQLSTFEQALDDFYEDSDMYQNQDVINLGEIDKQITEDDMRRVALLKDKILNKRVLDFGCGNGGVLQTLKKINSEVYGVELAKSVRDELNENGVLCKSNIKEYTNDFDLITMFHVLEHLTTPYSILRDIKQKLTRGGELVIETPNADDALIKLYDCKAFRDFYYWGCHVFLYTEESLKFLLKQAGFKINWCKQIQRYPLSNHLYWLSQSKPGGHNVWNDMNTEVIKNEYEKILKDKKMCDTLLISVSNG